MNAVVSLGLTPAELIDGIFAMVHLLVARCRSAGLLAILTGNSPTLSQIKKMCGLGCWGCIGTSLEKRRQGMKIMALFLCPLGHGLPAGSLFVCGHLRTTDRVAARMIQRLLPVGAELLFSLGTLGGDGGETLLRSLGIAIGPSCTPRGGAGGSG